MAFPDRRTADVLLTIVLFAIGLAIVYIARAVIVIFAFSVLFAYLIDPVVRFLQRHSLLFKNLRGPHVAEAYLALLIFFAFIAYGLAPAFHGQTQKFSQVRALVENLSSGEIPTEASNGQGRNDAKARWLKSFLSRHRSTVQGLAEAIERFAAAAISGIVVVPILAIFFLSDGEKLANDLIRLVSTSDTHETVRSLAAELNVMLRHYIRAKVTLGSLSLAYCSAALLALRFPNALALGFLAGVLEFIPVAGWMISATAIVTVGVLTHSHWIWMAALLGVWRILIDYWIAPRVMGHELELHPLLAIFTTMVGGAVGGIVGIYLSVPLVAALRVIWRRFGTLKSPPEHPPTLVSLAKNA
jgi:predicted PurR-regulated permease PerM